MTKVSKGRVLVVDDEATFRTIHSKNIKKLGYDVKTAENYEEALDLVKRFYFNAATIDVRLEDNDEFNEQGMDFIKKLHSLNEGTGGIIITAYPEPDRYRRAFIKYGAIDFLNKADFNQSDLEEALARALDQSKAAREARRQDELRPDKLTPGIDIFAFEKQLTDGRSANIRSFQTQLLKSLLPIVTSEQHQKLIQEKDMGPVLESIYRSRDLGQAYAIRLGSRKQLLQHKSHLEEQGIEVTILTTGFMSGLRYPVDIDVEAFT